MHTLKQLAKSHNLVPLEQEDVDWLQMLLSSWQILADLASADLIMWLPTRDGRFVAASLIRPATAATVHIDDVVGLYASTHREHLLGEALKDCRVVDGDGVQWAGLYSLSLSCVPVTRQGRCFAVISREVNVASPVGLGDDQHWAVEVADVLSEMIARGEYPSPDDSHFPQTGLPSVLDGAILVDEDGTVREISPNGKSAVRRLGLSQDLVGKSLIEEFSRVVSSQGQVDEALAMVAKGRAGWWLDVEANNSTVLLRAVPLRRMGEHLGALLLIRDVTETRRREKQLMSKDATIREIHHRVKNNLQTVSALLRIQERRSQSEDVKEALRDAGRRVESIATVHDALSYNVDEVVDFDEVAADILTMAVRVASAGPSMEVVVLGEFGVLPAEQASALATVLTELVSNSAEHAYDHQGGKVWVSAVREGEHLLVRVEDEGGGTPADALASGLGTKIVKTLVRGELMGRIDWSDREAGGTVVSLSFAPALGGKKSAGAASAGGTTFE